MIFQQRFFSKCSVVCACSLLTISTVILVGGFFLEGCSTTEYKPRPMRSGSVPQPLPNRVAPPAAYPWVSWSEGESFGGMPSSKVLYSIDAAIDQRNTAEASKLVTENIPKVHTVDELARVASSLLAQERGGDALKVLSSYYTTKNLPESSVSGPITILFGYAYGLQAAHGDVVANAQQAIAWLARNIRQENRAPDARSGKAKDAITLLLRTIGTSDIETIREEWREENSVDALISEELTARSNDAMRKPVTLASLWAETVPASTTTTPTTENAVAAETVLKWRVLALLPLSGKYAALATSMRQGIELAAAEHSPPDVEVVVRDDAGSVQQATSLIEQSNSANTLVGILGPMTVDVAQNIRPVARSVNVPQLSFPRGKDFTPGEGAYRFGLTPEAQIASVLKAYAKTAGNTAATIVAVLPDDDAGREFAEPLEQYSKSLGLNLIGTKYFPKGGSTQLSALALEIEDISPSAVFFGDNIVLAARFFSAFSTKKRHSITPLGSALWDDERALQQSRTVLEGALFPTGFFAEKAPVAPVADGTTVTDDSSASLPTVFAKNFQDRYSKAPNFLAAQGYDATVLMLQGLRDVGEKRTVSLEGLQSDGVSGKSVVLENGEISRTLPVLRFLQGELHAVQ